MLLWTNAVAFGALFLLQAQTVHAAGIIPASARSISGLRVGARDLPVIPAACQANCTPFAPFLTGVGCPVTECCSKIFEAGYFDCFKCVGTATNATDFTIAQEYVDVLTTSCISEGFPLPVLTLPGQNPDRTLVSALPPGASGLPVFPAEPGANSVSGASPISGSTPGSSASGASQSVNPPSGSSSAPPQSTVTAPPSPTSSAPSAPSSSGTAPPSAGVRVRSDPYMPVVGLGFAALLVLLV
ncbi:hypothetical protein MVEN_02424700 [Mycena venus]|uniref:Extracellular membrane protein CFEM domain-containing protein n=1 Tax=Mycena venus TaxID=2733690 RepID=A0A8H7CCU4_9AGAR|nr:hypothetical protein MVEN_02424700 [Mycena venus]